MCERCDRGYYGNALAGTPHDCQVCPCPNQGPCYQYDSNTVVCLECPKGYAGNLSFVIVMIFRFLEILCYVILGKLFIFFSYFKFSGERCDQCSDGYYGDVDGNSGSIKLCKPCDCNMNVDQNAVGICDSGTGECLKCIYNTDGPHCDQCLPGNLSNKYNNLNLNI